LTEFEDRWREWASAESRIDEERLRASLPMRLPSRRRRATRVILLAAAAGLVLAFVGLTTLHVSRGPVGGPFPQERSTIVHHLDDNVVLLIAEDSEPLYIVLADVPAEKGDSS
jgi:hypothetical protein